jgi:hypothetical protein
MLQNIFHLRTTLLLLTISFLDNRIRSFLRRVSRDFDSLFMAYSYSSKVSYPYRIIFVFIDETVPLNLGPRYQSEHLSLLYFR